MTNPIETLVAKWAEPDGIPFKGELITDDNCMCAQGQALHFIGGWDFEQLRDVNQSKADKVTAELLGISLAHSVLLRKINDGQPGAPSVVLTDPAKVLGDQAHIILAFWRHLDRMTPGQWIATRDAAGGAARDAARAAAGAAARGAAGGAAWDAAWDAARGAAGGAAGAAAWAAARASHEIQGAIIMREWGQPFYFLPLFGFADPEAVLAAENDQ